MQLLPNGKQTFSTAAGQPLANGKVYFYQPGTSTLATTYQDSAGQTPNANPVVLDGNGQAIIYGTGAYRQVVQDANGVTIWDQQTSAGDANWSLLNQSGGSGMVGFLQSGASSVLRTVQQKFQESVSVKDFAAKGDWTSSGGTDDTQAIQNALNAVSTAGGGVLYAPPGRYRLTAKVTVPSNVVFLGQPWLPDPSNGAEVYATTLIIDWGAGQDNHAVELSHSSGIEGFTFYYPGQAANTATTPVQFGYSISTPLAAGVYDNIHIRNITLYNSYKGIRLNNGGRWRVENIQGDPLSVGFSADQCLDVCYMKGVHFWNFYTQSNALENWVAANGIAFDFHRIDGLQAESLFCWNYDIGYSLGAGSNGGLWANFTNIICDKANTPVLANGYSQVYIDGFELISNAQVNPAVWIQSGGEISFSSGKINNTAAVGAQIDGGSTARFTGVDFQNQHAAAVVTTTSTDVYFSNCKWAIPPLGSYNVRVDGERLPNANTVIPLLAPLTAPSAITGGYQFNLNTTSQQTLTYDTTYISERNSLFVLEFNYQMVGNSTTWRFQFTIQTDTGASTQVSLAPLYPLQLNGTSGASKTVYIPFFINHGRYKQVMNITVVPTTAVAGAALNITNINLYEQNNQYTTDAQVSNMMRNGYNLDAYGMGQTLFAKGRNRLIITQPESGIGRPDETPIYGTWTQGDEVRTWLTAAGGYMGKVCTTAGTDATLTWAASGAYLLNQQVINGGNVYLCTTPGTSAASGGPTGTGSSITDGTVVWSYISPVAVWKSYGAIAA